MLDFQGRMLHRVLDICGGFAAARSRLAVSEHALRLWLDGRARLPERVFLRAADIVLEDDIARASSDRVARRGWASSKAARQTMSCIGANVGRHDEHHAARLAR